MSKTIRQLAEEIGVSKQAVHQKRKSKALSIDLQPFTSTVDGMVYIDSDGEKLSTALTSALQSATYAQALHAGTIQQQIEDKGVHLADDKSILSTKKRKKYLI